MWTATDGSTYVTGGDVIVAINGGPHRWWHSVASVVGRTPSR